MSKILEKAIVRITSNDSDNKNFGTGFIIKQERNFSYILTCAHVVEDVGGKGKIFVETFPGEILKCGSSESIDLAVIIVNDAFKGFSSLQIKIQNILKKIFLSEDFVILIKNQNYMLPEH